MDWIGVKLKVKCSTTTNKLLIKHSIAILMPLLEGILMQGQTIQPNINQHNKLYIQNKTIYQPQQQLRKQRSPMEMNASEPIKKQNYLQSYQNQFLMQNSKRRRGISLCHKSNPSPNPNQNLDNSVYTNTQTTRIQYPRYQIPASPSRHASAPKAKVNFAYPVNHYQPPYPQPQHQIPYPQQQISIEKILIPITHPHLHQEPIDDKSKQANIAEIPERYFSFEQCKESIGKKLFGEEVGSKKEKVLQESDRSNRWFTQEKVQTVSQTSIIESFKTYKQKEEKSWKNDEAEIENHYRVAEKQIQVIQVKPQIQKQEPKVAVIEPTKLKTEENLQCRRKRQLQIQKEVVNYFAEVKSKVQAPPTPQKQVKKPRDPAKLQQMQRRLLEIIKICDENIS